MKASSSEQPRSCLCAAQTGHVDLRWSKRTGVTGDDVDKLMKLAIIAGFLLGGFGVFYHYLIFLPDLERQRATAEEL